MKTIVDELDTLVSKINDVCFCEVIQPATNVSQLTDSFRKWMLARDSEDSYSIGLTDRVFLEAIYALETKGNAYLQHPRNLREIIFKQTARELGIPFSLLNCIWIWWGTVREGYFQK